MRVLGISGAPKKKGFTNLLLDEALDGARAGGALTDKIILNDLNFKSCQECGGCDETGACALSDDMEAIYKKLQEVDAFIVASPIYFGNLTAQLKAMIDRCHCLWVKKYVLKNNKVPANKPSASPRGERQGIFICVAGKENKEYFESAGKVIKIFFITTNIEYTGELFVDGLNDITANSPKLKEALLKSYELGLSLSKPKS